MLVHYVDQRTWRVVCCDPDERVTPTRSWTFVLEHVTCPACLALWSVRQAALGGPADGVGQPGNGPDAAALRCA